MRNAILPKALRHLRALIDPATHRAAPPASPQPGRYDRLIDAANRLPRPVVVYGTVALLFLAVIRPDLFDRGMVSLDRMPDELWWLVGAILAGHFGAREAHHLRHRHDHAATVPPETPPEQTAENPAAKGPS